MIKSPSPPKRRTERKSDTPQEKAKRPDNTVSKLHLHRTHPTLYGKWRAIASHLSQVRGNGKSNTKRCFKMSLLPRLNFVIQRFVAIIQPHFEASFGIRHF